MQLFQLKCASIHFQLWHKFFTISDKKISPVLRNSPSYKRFFTFTQKPGYELTLLPSFLHMPSDLLQFCREVFFFGNCLKPLEWLVFIKEKRKTPGLELVTTRSGMGDQHKNTEKGKKRLLQEASLHT